jgi:uncharacterized protein YaiL (DUF2058 family)
MANALQDQLLNIGLVDKKKAAQVKKDNYKKNKKSRHTKAAVVDENKLQIQQQIELKKQQDRLLNQQKQQQAELKAIRAQIKQLIDHSVIKDGRGDIDFNFQDKKLVKQLRVSDKVQQAIINGNLAIVKWEEKYYIVPNAVAAKILQRDESFVVVLNTQDEDESTVEDDYAQYQIPDDLMW